MDLRRQLVHYIYTKHLKDKKRLLHADLVKLKGDY